MTGIPSKPHSPEPWVQDRHDRKTVLDGFSRLVAVTTSREDAARIVSGVNAARGLGADGLDESPLSDALQILYEICLYQADVRFRNHIDRRGGFEGLVVRADKAWRAFGEDAFQNPIRKEGEKDGEEASPEAPSEKPAARSRAAASAGATPNPAATPILAAAPSPAATPAAGIAPAPAAAPARVRPEAKAPSPSPAAKKPAGK